MDDPKYDSHILGGFASDRSFSKLILIIDLPKDGTIIPGLHGLGIKSESLDKKYPDKINSQGYHLIGLGLFNGKCLTLIGYYSELDYQYKIKLFPNCYNGHHYQWRNYETNETDLRTVGDCHESYKVNCLDKSGFENPYIIEYNHLPLWEKLTSTK